MIKFCTFFSSFRLCLTNPSQALKTILATIDFSKSFGSAWHTILFHNLILAGLLPCFAHWSQYFLSDRRACVFFQNHESRFFMSAEVFYKNPFLALFIYLFSSTIFLLLCFLESELSLYRTAKTSHEHREMWFQHNHATAHTASCLPNVPRSCHLPIWRYPFTHMLFRSIDPCHFLWGYLKCKKRTKHILRTKMF